MLPVDSVGLLLNMPGFQDTSLFQMWVRVDDFSSIPLDGMSSVGCMFSHCRVPYMSTGEGIFVFFQPVLESSPCPSNVCCRAVRRTDSIDAPSISPPSTCNEHGHMHLTIHSVCVEHCHLLSCLISVVTSSFLLCTTLAVQFVMSVATEEGCRMAAETFGINYLASDTVQVKYV